VDVGDERHVQRSGLDLVDVHPGEVHVAQGRGRGHQGTGQLDVADAAERQAAERPVGRPEPVEHQHADVLDRQALQGRKQADGVVEVLDVADRDAGEQLGSGQPGRR